MLLTVLVTSRIDILSLKNRTRWTGELLQRIKARHGNALRLLTVMGVTEFTQQRIKDILRPRESDALPGLIDFS